MTRFRPLPHLVILLTLAITGSVFSQPRRDDYNLFEAQYRWLEIEDTGEPLVGLRDNDFYGPFDIGFRFPFFGEVYEEFYVSSNGFIGFGPTEDYVLAENQQLPVQQPPNNIIAIFWKDLDPEIFWADGMVYVGMREGKRIIQWQGVGEHIQEGRAPGNTITMQMILDQDGDILLQYRQIGDEFDLNIGTIGVENRLGTEGLTVRHNGDGAEIAEETALLISEHGPGEYLIWDGDRRALSGNAQERALRALGHTVARLRLAAGQELPEDLGDYDGVFINLGNFGGNGENYHPLTAAEGRILAQYLGAGGAVYLEGGDIWAHDDITDVHPLFFINGLDDGEALRPPISGVADSPLDGLLFDGYEAPDNDFVDRIEPVEGAVELMTFRDGDGGEHIGMVGYAGEGYRTVGSSIQFGALVDGEDGTREELMARIIGLFQAPPPAFPAPVNLRAWAADGEVTLAWDMPRRAGMARRNELELRHRILQLSKRRAGGKPDADARREIAQLKSELSELLFQLANTPRRDELASFNIYLDGELYDATNARQYTAIELENGREYRFAVTAVYEDPDGESEPAGPISAIPVGILELPVGMDFERTNGSLQPQPPCDGWQWGVSAVGAASGERAWGTLLDLPYPNLASFDLLTPPIDLTDARRAWLSFNYLMDCEAGWDGGQVQISTDGGQRWELLVPTNGYPNQTVYALDEQPGFTGSTGGWRAVGFDLGNYLDRRIILKFMFRADESNFRPYAGWFIDDLSITEPQLGRLTVTVRDEGENLLRDALVELVGFGSAMTPQDGVVSFDMVPVGRWLLRITKAGFIPFEDEVEIVADQQRQIEVFLEIYDVRLNLEPNQFIEDLQTNQRVERQFRMVNNGRDGTDWRLYIDFFPNQQNAADQVNHRVPPRRDEPFDFIGEINLTDPTGDQYFIGAEFVRNQGPHDYRFVASAGDFGSGDCRFYHFSREGELLSVVPQNNANITGWGLRDLTYDGRYIYGAVGNRIYKMDPNSGDWISLLPATPLAVNRAIAYIPGQNVFWVGNWDDTWFKVDRNGRVLDRNTQHGLTGVTGMGWNPSDPDGYYLYIHNQEPDDGGAAVYRYNPATRDVERVLVTAEAGEGTAGGMFITYLYDTQSYLLGAVIQGPEDDLLRLYELWPRQSWLSVTPAVGHIEGEGGVQDFTLTLNTEGLFDTTLVAEIEIGESLSGSVQTLRVEVSIEGGAAIIRGTVSLEGGGDVNQVRLTLNNGLARFPDDQGNYIFERIAPGEYILRAEMVGFAPFISEPLNVDPDEELVVDLQLNRIPSGRIFGRIVTVYDEENGVEGVEISAIRTDERADVAITESNADGEYEFILPVGTYDVGAFFEGWRRQFQRDVQLERDGEAEVNFILDDREPVRFIRTDGGFDDRISILWNPPGLGGEPVELQLDDGRLANGVYLQNREDIIAVRFEPEGMYDILSLTIYLIRRGDLGLPANTAWPNSTYDEIYLKVFAEDPQTGLPGELILDAFIDSHLDRNQPGWTSYITRDLRYRSGPFYIGWSQDPAGQGYEAAGLDGRLDHPGACYIRFDGEWRQFDGLPGDNILRAVIWSYYDQEEQVIAPRGRSPRRVAPDGVRAIDLPPAAFGLQLMNPIHQEYVLPELKLNWTELLAGRIPPRRDELVGFRVMIDGEPGHQDLLDPGVTDWIDTVGSENENQAHTYSVTTVYADGSELDGNEAEGTANLPPGPVNGLIVQTEGNAFTVSWEPPRVNADGTECTDYAGAEIYMDGEPAAEVDAETFQWEGAIADGAEGWHEFAIIAHDEVPNRSMPVYVVAPLGRAIVYDFEPNTAVFRAEPGAGGWSRRQNPRFGPGNAHSGLNVWATRPIEGTYIDNAEWLITTLNEYYVESPSARLEFYHYMSAEAGHDGGQLLASVDGGDWFLLEPDGGYPDQTVGAFDNEPAFTGETGDWVLITFNLAEFEGHTIKFRWRFASDRSISWYPGWYLDDVVLWGCSLPNYATLRVTVTDQDGAPVEGAVVTAGRFSAQSDRNGTVFFNTLTQGEWTITASKPRHRPVTREVELAAGDEVDLELELPLPQLVAEPNQFEFEMGGADRFEVQFNLANFSPFFIPYWIRLTADPNDRDRPNGRQIRRTVHGPGRDDPWDVAFRYDLTGLTDSRRIMGAEFAGDRFYITSADPIGQPMVWVLDWDGRVVSSFRQPVEQPVGWGLRDLAWDGRLIYGSQDRNIYSFDLQGQAGRIQPGAPLTVNRALTYSPDDDGFWAAEWDSPWYLVNRDGEVVRSWDEHGLSGVYGFAWHPDDPDGMPLYALNLEPDGNSAIYRADPVEGEIERIYDIAGPPTGCFITSSWDADRWILGAVIGREDQVLTGYELNRHLGWISAEPFIGELNGGADVDVTVSVRVPPDAGDGDEYSAVLSVRAFGGEIVRVDFNLTVTEAFQHFPNPQESDNQHIIHIEQVSLYGRPLSLASEIAAITPNERIGGVMRWLEQPGDLVAYSNEQAFEEGDLIGFLIWDRLTDREYSPEVEVVDGGLQFIVGAESTVILSVPHPASQTIHLDRGWNLVSTYIQPANPDITHILRNINERGHLVLVKDGQGRFWWPQLGFNGLGDWNPLECYQINVSAVDSFLVSGVQLQLDTPINLTGGWNSVAYILDHPVASRTALAGIMDQILIAKDGIGRFMVPRFNFYGLGDMVPGYGYKIKVQDDVQLVYRDAQPAGVGSADYEMDFETAPTGRNMSLLITDMRGIVPEAGGFIVVRTDQSKIEIGRVSVSKAPIGLALRGDDPITDETDGAVEGEGIRLFWETDREELSLTLGLRVGNPIYQTDGFIAGPVSVEAPIPGAIWISSINPNPFNSRTILKFGLRENGDVQIRVVDIAGRTVQFIPATRYPAGDHLTTIDAGDLPNGIYYLVVSTDDFREARKVAVVR